jgi:hypothetical protein
MGWDGDTSPQGTFLLFEGTLTTTLIKVAFVMDSCQKKVPEQATKRDMSFYPLWHGKSLTEGRTKIQEWSSAYHQPTVAKRPILLRWIGTIGPTTWPGSQIKGQPSTTAYGWEIKLC